jgi:hypothetical protein
MIDGLILEALGLSNLIEKEVGPGECGGAANFILKSSTCAARFFGTQAPGKSGKAHCPA